ncbi:hypothetical protein LZ30DRAFT_19612 [Colletotrichum cereale]|nr:hypothetical protein LZ30DRAFT_19612 [Colletotrichum cereale]
MRPTVKTKLALDLDSTIPSRNPDIHHTTRSLLPTGGIMPERDRQPPRSEYVTSFGKLVVIARPWVTTGCRVDFKMPVKSRTVSPTLKPKNPCERDLLGNAGRATRQEKNSYVCLFRQPPMPFQVFQVVTQGIVGTMADLTRHAKTRWGVSRGRHDACIDTIIVYLPQQALGLASLASSVQFSPYDW